MTRTTTDVTIGIAAAIGVLLADLVNPWASALIAIAALAWFIVRARDRGVKIALLVAVVALLVAGILAYFMS